MLCEEKRGLHRENYEKKSGKKRIKDINETLLMINSLQQFNEFDDEQHRKMISINDIISKKNKFMKQKMVA